MKGSLGAGKKGLTMTFLGFDDFLDLEGLMTMYWV